MTQNLKLKVLSTEEVSTIYEKCLSFLSNKGVKAHHSQVPTILDKGGAWVDFNAQHVRFFIDIIEAALASVPRRLMLAGRDEASDLVVPHPCMNPSLRLHDNDCCFSDSTIYLECIWLPRTILSFPLLRSKKGNSYQSISIQLFSSTFH